VVQAVRRSRRNSITVSCANDIGSIGKAFEIIVVAHRDPPVLGELHIGRERLGIHDPFGSRVSRGSPGLNRHCAGPAWCLDDGGPMKVKGVSTGRVLFAPCADVGRTVPKCTGGNQRCGCVDSHKSRFLLSMILHKQNLYFHTPSGDDSGLAGYPDVDIVAIDHKCQVPGGSPGIGDWGHYVDH